MWVLRSALLALCLLLVGGCAALLAGAQPPFDARQRGAEFTAGAAPSEPASSAAAEQTLSPQPPSPGEDAPPAPAVPELDAPVPAPPLPPRDAPAGAVPILMYHYIRVNPDPTDKIGAGLSVTPEDFAAQMAFLAERGYRSMLPHELSDQDVGDDRVVVLTFDDGYVDAYEEAYPVLRRHGFTATFYVITALIGHPRYMTWDQVRALAADGMVIGSHTVGHPDLRHSSASDLHRQLHDSRAEIERQIGLPVLDFSYPSGRFNTTVLAEVREAGYERAVTTQPGWYAPGKDLLTLPRVRISGGMTLARFAEVLGETILPE